MKTKAIKTRLVRPGDDLLEVIGEAIGEFSERGVLVVTSKIVSVCQGRLVPLDRSKHEVVKEETDWYIDPEESKYEMMITLAGQTLGVNAGLDESNAFGKLVLWPAEVQETANKIWRFLREHYGVKEAGVVITDSKSIPLRRGVEGTAMAHCGFRALCDRRGEKDLLGREIKIKQVNVMESVAAAGVLEMGEVAERTPLCLVEEIKGIEFAEQPPTEEELRILKIQIDDDIYAPILLKANWQKGKRK